MSDFQARAVAIGRSYEDQVAAWLVSRGYFIDGRNVRHESGVQFDIAARKVDGEVFGVECKASDGTAKEAKRGMRRSDNVWKVLGYLYLLDNWRKQGRDVPRYMVFTSDVPDPLSTQGLILNAAQAAGDLTMIHLPFQAEAQL